MFIRETAMHLSHMPVPEVLAPARDLWHEETPIARAAKQILQSKWSGANAYVSEMVYQFARGATAQLLGFAPEQRH